MYEAKRSERAKTSLHCKTNGVQRYISMERVGKLVMVDIFKRVDSTIKNRKTKKEKKPDVK